MKCDYCAAAATVSVKIEEAKLGDAVRDKSGASLGRPVVSPAIYANACDKHAPRVQQAVEESAERVANKRRIAAKKAAQTRKWGKAQQSLL